MAAPAMAPRTCATMYGSSCEAGKRPPAHNPTDTAGLKWPPEIGPSAYAQVSTVRPNASATPANPMPSCGNAAASTALPHPPRTSHNVPRNSAETFDNINIPLAVCCLELQRVSDVLHEPVVLRLRRRRIALQHTPVAADQKFFEVPLDV